MSCYSQGMGRGSNQQTATPTPTRSSGRVVAWQPPVTDVTGRLSGIDLRYDVDVDYAEDFDCENYGCTEGGICRCSTIANAEVEDISPSALASCWKRSAPGPLDALTLYGIERIISAAHLSKHDFEVEVTGGYYGEEIGSVLLDINRAEEIEATVGEYFKQRNLTDQVEFLLINEYGQLLPQLQGARYQLEKIDTSRLHFAAKTHASNLRQSVVERYRREQSYPPFDAGADRPLGVVMFDHDHYRVIDGYHRLSAARQRQTPEVLVIVAHPTTADRHQKNGKRVPRLIASRQRSTASR
jgi:hypothetical protein